MNKFFLFAITLLLFSCKKDEQLTIEQNFLCDVVTERSYTGENSTTKYNYVHSIKIEGDVIVFDNFEFPLSAFNMKTGSGSSTIPLYSGTVKLTLSNKFKDLDLYMYLPSTLSGPTNIKWITGKSTSLAPTTESSNLFDYQTGNYQLSVETQQTSNGIDTAYSGVFPVSYSAPYEYFSVDGEGHFLRLCHSYFSRESSNSSSNSGHQYSYQNLTWTNYNLYYDRFETINYWNSSQIDTTHFHYEGMIQ